MVKSEEFSAISLFKKVQKLCVIHMANISQLGEFMIPYLIFKCTKLKSQQKKIIVSLVTCMFVYTYIYVWTYVLRHVCGDHRSRKFAVRLYLLGMSEAIHKASTTWLSEPELS